MTYTTILTITIASRWSPVVWYVVFYQPLLTPVKQPVGQIVYQNILKKLAFDLINTFRTVTIRSTLAKKTLDDDDITMVT